MNFNVLKVALVCLFSVSFWACAIEATESDLLNGDIRSTQVLQSGILKIEQSWKQEPSGFTRKAVVHIPNNTKKQMPLLIVLHGKGGNAARFINAYKYIDNHIIVAPQGYLNCWNVAREESKAPDVEYIRLLIESLKKYDNVNGSEICILGSSNGAALLSQLLIELDAEVFQKAISLMGELNTYQYQQNTFRIQGEHGDFHHSKVPSERQELLTINGTDDTLVPYLGGVGVLKYEFLSAQLSTYLWAKAMGYQGEILPDANGIEILDGIIKYNYLDEQVTHYKLKGARHGVSPYNQHVKQMIIEFLK